MAFAQEEDRKSYFHDEDGRVLKLLRVLQMEYSKKVVWLERDFSQSFKGNSNSDDAKYHLTTYRF